MSWKLLNEGSEAAFQTLFCSQLASVPIHLLALEQFGTGAPLQFFLALFFSPLVDGSLLQSSQVQP